MTHEPMTDAQLQHVRSVLFEVEVERRAQHSKWGEQNHTDGTGDEHLKEVEMLARLCCDRAFAAGEGTWRHILSEETAEAEAEAEAQENTRRLRTELVQVAAVAVAWVEAIDRRKPPEHRAHSEGGSTSPTPPLDKQEPSK